MALSEQEVTEATVAAADTGASVAAAAAAAAVALGWRLPKRHRTGSPVLGTLASLTPRLEAQRAWQCWQYWQCWLCWLAVLPM